MAAHQSCDTIGTIAAVNDVAREAGLLQQQSVDVGVAAGGHAHLDGVGVGLGLLQQVFHGGDTGSLVGKQHIAGGTAKDCNDLKVFVAVLAGAGSVVVDQSGTVGAQNGVAIGGGALILGQSNGAVGTSHVGHGDGLAERRLHILCHQAVVQVGVTAGVEADHKAHGSVGVIGRLFGAASAAVLPAVEAAEEEAAVELEEPPQAVRAAAAPTIPIADRNERREIFFMVISFLLVFLDRRCTTSVWYVFGSLLLLGSGNRSLTLGSTLVGTQAEDDHHNGDHQNDQSDGVMQQLCGAGWS